MRILGIDFGDRNIGLAVSDHLFLTSQALCKYQIKNKKDDEKYFKALVSQYDIGEIVVGLPLRMDGTPGTRAQKTKEFAHWLGNTLRLPINFWDERLTTKQALGILRQQKFNSKRKKKLKDQISASIILSAYLESKRVKSHVPQES